MGNTGVFVLGLIQNSTEIERWYLKKYATNTENICQTDKVRESKSVNREVLACHPFLPYLKKKDKNTEGNGGLSGCLAAFRSDRSSLGTQPCLSCSSLTDTHADKNRQIHPGTRVSCFRTRMTSRPPSPKPPSLSPSLLYSLLAAKIPARFNICGFTDCLTALLLEGSVKKNKNSHLLQ